jgi:hypothetical protein
MNLFYQLQVVYKNPLDSSVFDRDYFYLTHYKTNTGKIELKPLSY